MATVCGNIYERIEKLPCFLWMPSEICGACIDGQGISPTLSIAFPRAEPLCKAVHSIICYYRVNPLPAYGYTLLYCLGNSLIGRPH